MSSIEIFGSWQKGYSYDLHTISSNCLGPNQFGYNMFDNTRTEMGDLVYRLKYKGECVSHLIIDLIMKEFNGIESLDYIIPVPSSKYRTSQPVDEISKELGRRVNVKTLVGFLAKSNNEELKSITDPIDRHNILRESIFINGDKDILCGKSIILIDDLYRSGETLNACCNVLYEQTNVSYVSVLTMTKTRSNR